MMSDGLGRMAVGRRQALLETAAREFAAAGYERASLNRIIRACGMSKSSFYHYVGSKEALFDAVVREAAAALGRELEIPDPGTFAGPDFWDRIAQLGDRLLALGGHEGWYADFGRLFYLPGVPEGTSRELQAIRGRIADWVKEVLAVGRACGAVRADVPGSLQFAMVLAVLEAMDRWSLGNLEGLETPGVQDLVRLQVDMVRRLLAP